MNPGPSIDYWLSFLTGFFGSMHCVGMCGAIVIAYSTQGITPERSKISRLTAHLTYNGGRVFSYVIVGSLFGFVGRGLGALQGVGYWFSLVAGIALVLSGLILLRIVPLLRFSDTVDLAGAAHSVIARFYRASFGILVAMPKLESKFYLGLLTPLLPCGLLYSMFLKAAGTENPVEAGTIMLMFGLGIAPALVLTGMVGSYLGEKIRRWGDRIAALTILLMGISLVLRSLGVPPPFTEGHQH